MIHKWRCSRYDAQSEGDLRARCQYFRSLNTPLWQSPLIIMPLSEGLRFAVASPVLSTSARCAPLLPQQMRYRLNDGQFPSFSARAWTARKFWTVGHRCGAGMPNGRTLASQARTRVRPACRWPAGTLAALLAKRLLAPSPAHLAFCCVEPCKGAVPCWLAVRAW